jgi:amidohydrolase
MKDIRPLIQEILPSLVQLRHELHAEPELGFEEVNTSRRVLEKLKSVPGVEIRTGVAKTGIVATLGSEKKGPCVALRAEMDALPIEEATGKPYASKVPGKMHACGHDGHTTCAVGAFLVLSKIQDELKGPVKFVFQPSEESVGGARVMCEEGCLENPKVDAIFGLHGYPIAGNLRLGEVALARGPAMAGSRGFTIEVKGKGGHAAAPHLCIDPVYIGAQIVNAVQSMVSRSTNPLESMVVSVTRFVAGTARNIIPETALLEGTLRALKTVWIGL